MIYLKEESISEYEKYCFNYKCWGIPESLEDVETLYKEGYLPYSGDEKELPIYYLCRSSRVDLAKFSLSSENKRVLKKIAEVGLSFDYQKINGEEASLDDSLTGFVLEYFSQKHGGEVMIKERLLSILRYSPLVQVYICRKNEGLIGVIITQEIGTLVHYWFAAYELKYVESSVGMGLMISFLEKLKQAYKTRHVYLGTLYGKKASYKTNVGNLEYFDGQNWVLDPKRLKVLLNQV